MPRCKIHEWAALILKKKYGSYDICNYVAVCYYCFTVCLSEVFCKEQDAMTKNYKELVCAFVVLSLFENIERYE
jgi:hypothetical protein